MLPIFTKPLETIVASDLEGLRGWPESLVVEFKRDLPCRSERGPDGRDNWYSGNKVEQYAKEAIFREIVALANSSGGHLLLGITESEDKPSVATGINPLPRCAELAENLERAAQSIDPPIWPLGARAIPTSEGAGVVLFRVPASVRGPHRNIDKECYVRRGTESVPVSMREVHDMVLSSLRRVDRAEAQFEASRTGFANWFGSAPRMTLYLGFRCTAVPIVGLANLGRLFNRPNLRSGRTRFAATIDGTPRLLHAQDLPTHERPVVRGTQFFDEHAILELHSGGLVQLWFRVAHKPKLYLGWLLGYTLQVLDACHRLRKLAAVPEQEYAIEIELNAGWGGADIPIGGAEDHTNLGTIRAPFTFPRLQFAGIETIDEVLSQLATDIRDAAGSRYPNSCTVSLQTEGDDGLAVFRR